VLGVLLSCKHFSLMSTSSFNTTVSLYDKLLMKIAISGSVARFYLIYKYNLEMQTWATFPFGNCPFLLLALPILCCVPSSLFLLVHLSILLAQSEVNVHVAESSTRLDFWKGASDAGCSIRWEKEEDKKIQGVSLEMHIFSFIWNSCFVCYLWWALVS